MDNQLPIPIDNLDSCTAKMLAFEERFSRRLLDASHALVTGLSVPETGLFRALLSGPCTLTYLCWRLRRDKGNLSRSIKLLKAMGYATTWVPERDGRERQVELTEKGLRVARDIERQWRDRVRTELQYLPLRQRRRLASAMARFEEILDRDSILNLVECAEERERLRRA